MTSPICVDASAVIRLLIGFEIAEILTTDRRLARLAHRLGVPVRLIGGR